MAVSPGVRKTVTVVAALICVCGLVVGFAHWRVHELETGDVVWTAPAFEEPDTAVVVGGRIYTYAHDRLVIRELRTGRRIAVTNEIGFRAYVGDGGQVAIEDLAGHRLAFYSRDGKELWHRTGVVETPAAIGTDGGLDVIGCDGDKHCRTTHYDAAGRMTGRTARHSPDFAQAATIGSLTFGPDQGVVRVPPVPIDIEGDRARELRGGRAWGPAVATADDHALAQVGDLLVGLSRRRGTCVFEAVRSGKRAWTTSTPCPDLGFPTLAVFAHRLYAYNSTDNGYDVVTTDLGGERAAGMHIQAAAPAKGDRRELWPTPSTLVLVTTGAVAGYTPDSGKKLWERELRRDSADPLDDSHKLFPAVTVSGEVIDVSGDTRPPWPQLALGHDTPSTTHTFIDPATGDTTAELAVPWGARVSGTDDGGAVVFGDHRVRLVSPGGGR